LFKVYHVSPPLVLLRSQRGFYLGDNSLESRNIFYGKMCQSLPVDNYSRLIKSGDKAGIRKTFGAAGGVDSDDPQFAKITFPIPPVPVCIEQGFGNRIFGGLVV